MFILKEREISKWPNLTFWQWTAAPAPFYIPMQNLDAIHEKQCSDMCVPERVNIRIVKSGKKDLPGPSAGKKFQIQKVIA